MSTPPPEAADGPSNRRDAKAVPAQIPVIVVMGVSASGKSTLGKALARRLGCPFEEGDNLHPQANIDKMRSGHPLNDEDRKPWLDRVARWIAEHHRSASGGVVSCSALKLSYRDRLRKADADLPFVFPDPDRETLRQRIAARKGHFMPASLLDSQLETLEPPGDHERCLRLPGEMPVEEMVDRICAWLAKDA